VKTLVLSLARSLVPSRALLRLTAYCTIVFLGVALVAARRLRADIGEAGLSAGRRLSKLADLLGGTETIELNGEQMHHSSSFTKQDVKTVLDRFENYCADSPSMLGRAMSDFPKSLSGTIERAVPMRAFRLGFVRDEAKGRGMIACFVSDKPSTFAGLKERLERLVTTLRLGELGHFRYVYAEPSGEGSTHVVALWADSDLDIRAMFPAKGDAAGTDSVVLPRPPNARRTLSASAAEMPYAVRMYVSADASSSVDQYYRGWMAEHRFSEVEGAQNREGTSAYLRDDGYQAFVTIDDQSGHTYVTLLEAGDPDVPSVAAIRAVAK
jgi:hypothetical protein